MFSAVAALSLLLLELPVPLEGVPTALLQLLCCSELCDD